MKTRLVHNPKTLPLQNILILIVICLSMLLSGCSASASDSPDPVNSDIYYESSKDSKDLESLLPESDLIENGTVSQSSDKNRQSDKEDTLEDENKEEQNHPNFSSSSQTEQSDINAREHKEASDASADNIDSSDSDEADKIIEVQNNSSLSKLHVENDKLKNENGETIQLKGISTYGIAWFPQYINEPMFASLKELFDINVIRLAMYTEEYDGYCSGGSKEELKNLIDQGVQAAQNQDLYMIIDWHILSDGNPLTHVEEASAFFEEMSEKYADKDHVIYEICNEPNGTDWDSIAQYARTIIPIIRENDEDALILVGTPQWDQLIDAPAADPLSEFDNVLYTLHFYAGTHKEDIQDRLKAALEKKLPVFVSEFGLCDASGNGPVDEASSIAWLDLLDENEISYIAWNLSNKDETSAILIGDQTEAISESDLSGSGLFLMEQFSSRSQPE